MDRIKDILESWKDEKESVNSTEDIIEWIRDLNRNTYVKIEECSVDGDSFWFFDDYNGEILNRKRSFFSVKGIRLFEEKKFIEEQPIIIQPEIGYLGIIGKKINGVLHFLMQAKIEPGNVNCVQISPTIQATKSNFTRAHGGKLPTYFELFEHSDKYEVLYDQIQSEQAARFYKKRNRNMLMIVDEDFEIYPNYKWMTLGQIKKLMKIDNLVNMDTRTVLSGLPLSLHNLHEGQKKQYEQFFSDMDLFNSIFNPEIDKNLPLIYQKINNYKMFTDTYTSLIPLQHLVHWKVDDKGVTCDEAADFCVRFYDIEITGREVQKWSQPLFKANGKATFGLVYKRENNLIKVLVKITPEIGSFDKVELGPSVLWEPTHKIENDTAVDQVFRNCLKENIGVINDVILSEEGGRFYHEQNRNVILEIDSNKLENLPNDYIWTDLGSLFYLIQVNNCLNIQLRNLLSLLNI